MITDARVLRDDFLPGEVVHRDQEIEELSRNLSPLIEEEQAEHVLIHGPSGAGKTCIARHTLDQLKEHRLDIRTTYINCWENYNRFRVLYKALEGLGKTLDVHRQSTPKDELLTRLRDTDAQPYVLILDEADQLEDQKILYDLHSMDHITMILIANKEEDVFARMEDRIRSRLMTARRIKFPPYSLHALTAILNDRTKWGLHPDTISEEQLELIADRSAGDARIAIGTLRNAARHATEQNQSRITEDIIEDAVPAAQEETKQKNLDLLNPHQRALYDIIQNTESITPADLYQAYEENIANPKSERTLRNYLQKMVHYNLISAEGEKRGRRYTTS